jgi:hypothetical protein
MDLRTKICIWIIVLGMVNFLAYTIGYTIVGGESVRGKLYEDRVTGEQTYYLDSGQEVGRDAFVYIGIHSISIWITVAAIMLSMLTLAKDRITDSMQSAAMRGRTLCTVLAVAIGICTAGLTFQFIHTFVDHFRHPLSPPPTQVQPDQQPQPPHSP